MKLFSINFKFRKKEQNFEPYTIYFLLKQVFKLVCITWIKRIYYYDQEPWFSSLYLLYVSEIERQYSRNMIWDKSRIKNCCDAFFHQGVTSKKAFIICQLGGEIAWTKMAIILWNNIFSHVNLQKNKKIFIKYINLTELLDKKHDLLGTPKISIEWMQMRAAM